MTITQLAGSLPRNPRFREWLSAFNEIGVPDFTEDEATLFIRVTCGVVSRRDLETSPEAAQRFHDLIRKPFVEWCEQLEQTA